MWMVKVAFTCKIFFANEGVHTHHWVRHGQVLGMCEFACTDVNRMPADRRHELAWKE